MLDHSCTSLMVQVIDLFGKKNYFLFSKQFCRDIIRHADAVRYCIPLKVMFGLTYNQGLFANCCPCATTKTLTKLRRVYVNK